MEEKDNNEEILKDENDLSIDLTEDNKVINVLNAEDLEPKGLDFDFEKLFLDLKKEPKDLLNYTDKTISKNIRSKINNVFASILYRSKIAKEITNKLVNENLVVQGGEATDHRSLNNVCYMIGSPLLSEFKKHTDEYIKEEIDIAKDLIKYPYQNILTTGKDYNKLHNESIDTYMTKLYNYFAHDFLDVCKKHDTFDFTKLSEKEIYILYTSVISTQDLLDKYTKHNVPYFESKFDTYEKLTEFNRIANLTNTAGVLFTAECFKKKINTKQLNLGFHLGNTLGGSEEPNDEFNYNVKIYESLFNFYKKQEEIKLPIDVFFDRSDDEIDQISFLFDGLFNDLTYRNNLTKALYSSNYFAALYIDGVSFESIIKNELGQNFEKMSKDELMKYEARKFIKLVENGDKLVEYAYINTFKNTYTTKVVPLTFDYSDKTVKDRYQSIVKQSKIRPLNRYDKITNDVKTKVDGLKKTSKEFANLKNELPHSREFNKVLNNFIFKYDARNVNKEEFNVLMQRVFKDAKARVEDMEIDKTYTKDVDVSPVFKNKDELKSALRSISRHFDFGYSLISYATRADDVELTTSTSRDALRYFLALENMDTKNKCNKTFRYIKACQLRDSSNNKSDYSLMREITNELIKDMLNSNVRTDLSKKEDILSMNAKMNQAFLIRQTFDADPAYFNKFKQEEPFKYYKLMEKCAYYERYYEDTKIESMALAGFVNEADMKDPRSIVSYSSGTKGMFYSPNINTSRNLNALNLAFLNNSYTNCSFVKLDLDMSMYGTFGTKNDLVYDHLNEVSLDDFIAEAQRQEDEELAEGDTVDVLDTFGYLGLSIRSANVMLSYYKNSFDTTRELVKDFVKDENYNDYFLSSIAINGKQLSELVNTYEETHDNIKLNKMDLASAYFAHAINDPNSNITFTNLVLKDNQLLAKTSVVKKNYDLLAKRTKDNHTVLEKFGHMLGMKYNADKMVKAQEESLRRFATKENLANISLNFENKFSENFAKFNSKIYLANVNDKINELKSIDLLNRRNLEVDLNNKKENNKINEIDNTIKDVHKNNDLTK